MQPVRPYLDSICRLSIEIRITMIILRLYLAAYNIRKPLLASSRQTKTACDTLMNNELILLLGLITALTLIIILIFQLKRMRKRLPPEAEAKSCRGYQSELEKLPEKERILQDAGDMDEFDDIIERLLNIFEREKTYLNPAIRIQEVSEKLGTNKTYLSKAIRCKTNKNFCQLVHYYRVREAIKLYIADQSLTIAELCNKVGFNSMTTFNTAFGRNTGFTPAEWCKNYKKKKKADEQSVAGNKKQTE